MPVRKIFSSSDNDKQTIELGLAPKGRLVSLVVHDASIKGFTTICIDLSTKDALELCKEIKLAIQLVEGSVTNG